MPALFHRLLIANRGEVAVRVARACDVLGIAPVFAVSEADRDAPYTRGREVVVIGPGRAASSYLDVERVVRAAFGGDRVYLEKLVEGGRHVEIQVFADRYGRAVHLGERDCTVQRNHQKLIEESPSPALSADQRTAACEAAARAAAQIGYVGAGTMEMLLDPAGQAEPGPLHLGQGTLRFMEMNCRLQVEHTVSEERSGLDLVDAQIRVAAGRPLPWPTVALAGHAIECRINAEDPANNFAPAPGRITKWQPPPGVRVDTHVETGYVVPPLY